MNKERIREAIEKIFFREPWPITYHGDLVNIKTKNGTFICHKDTLSKKEDNDTKNVD